MKIKQRFAVAEICTNIEPFHSQIHTIHISTKYWGIYKDDYLTIDEAIKGIDKLSNPENYVVIMYYKYIK